MPPKLLMYIVPCGTNIIVVKSKLLNLSEITMIIYNLSEDENFLFLYVFHIVFLKCVKFCQSIHFFLTNFADLLLAPYVLFIRI